MRYSGLLLLSALAMLAAGCLTSSYTPSTYYALAPSIDVEAVDGGSESLGVRPLAAAQPYKRRQMAYREGPYTLGYYENDEWAELPADTVTRALMDAVVATQRFHDVGYAVDLAAPEYVLTGELRRFDEVRADDGWTAECEMRLVLRKGAQRDLVWADVLTAREPVESHAPAAFAAAMSRAIARLVRTAAAHIALQ